METTKGIEGVQATVFQFIEWLDRYGETSYDHQSFFASDLGRRAKALYYTNPILGTARGFANDFLRGILALSSDTLLETTEISDS